MTTVENNLPKLNITFVTINSKPMNDLINKKQNNTGINLAAGIYKNCSEIHQVKTSKRL